MRNTKIKWNEVPWENGYLYRNNDKDWEDSTKEKLLYITEESRLYLQSLLDNNNRLLNKAFFLLTVFTGLIGYIFTKCKSKDFIINKGFMYFLAIYLLCLIIIYLFVIIKYILPSRDYFFVGRNPKHLVCKPYMELDIERMLVEQLMDYYRIITYNEQLNRRMARNIIICVISIPVPPMLAFCITVLI